MALNLDFYENFITMMDNPQIVCTSVLNQLSEKSTKLPLRELSYVVWDLMSKKRYKDGLDVKPEKINFLY